MIAVANKYHGAKGINIMRGSVFGNPYKLQDGYSREESIRLYREWLRGQYRRKTRVYDALLKLSERFALGENLVVVCCCTPKACHGDVLKDASEKIAELRHNKQNAPELVRPRAFDVITHLVQGGQAR